MDITPLAAAIASHAEEDTLELAWTEADWQRFAPLLERRELRAGELLLRRGLLEPRAWLVEQGHLQVFVDGSTPLTHRIAHVRAGSIVGEPGLFVDAPRMASAEATTGAVVWGVTRDALQDLGRREPRLALEFVRAAAAVMALRMRANLERGIPAA